MRTLFTLLLVLATTTAAHAGGRPPGRTEPLDVETKVEVERYGTETLMADLVYMGFSMVGSAAVGDDDEGKQVGVMFVSAGLYALGSPFVHMRNGNPSGAIQSLILRVGMPIGLGAGAYYAAGGECDDFLCGSHIAAMAGASLGAISAMVIDHSWLARKKIKRTYVYGGLTPSLHVTDERAVLTLGGSF